MTGAGRSTLRTMRGTVPHVVVVAINAYVARCR
jgi:hypothetical protein